MGNICSDGKSSTFKWRIEGFSSLLEHKSNHHYSHPFPYKGFNWKLMVYPKNTEEKSGKACIGLSLVLDDAGSLPSSFAIVTDLRLRICDQVFNKHYDRQGERLVVL
ncbi:MATH domain and coiled-coil domain-containing protein At3g58370-like [Asparagus officinalis]|uniref:MATH domain and coiled-coil domain-containing protein At3g58370-like n=1 Tax=Asparagus officinalis TaxID=4686 RepID=UPI00098E6833|nr:MATH domain and coiled-coil domain-containing protein At3g58370-like [Asparagus officinalis]